MSKAGRRSIKIAIMALGGQGGGVLSGWIVDVMERAGYIAQSTSVPGVAQRTGATIYYVEAFPKADADAAGREPVMALMPVPDDVDIVLAAELMEAGRAVLRGLVSPERTALIASTHRIYAISEKSAMGDGIARTDRIREAARRGARMFIGFDMQAVADDAGGMISAPLFGALAGAGVLPIERSVFEETIRAGGVAVEVNLKAFDAACRIAADGAAEEAPAGKIQENTSEAEKVDEGPILAELRDRLPAEAHEIALEGARRCADYQSRRYARLYSDRVLGLLAACKGENDYPVLTEAARHLALWMTYEDTIRVADLKTRASRFERFRTEVCAQPGQIVQVSEYLHPRVEEVCDTLPAPIGRFILNTSLARKAVGFVFGHGRRVPTTRLRGFLQLYIIAMLRPMRPVSLRYRETQAEIEAWLARIAGALAKDRDFAMQVVAGQRLIKGYGDTFARGHASYRRIVAALDVIEGRPDAAAALKCLNEAALADEHGAALTKALAEMNVREAEHAA